MAVVQALAPPLAGVLMEAAEMILYLFSACSFATLLRHAASPLRHFIVSGIFRRVLYGVATGATVIGIVMTPWGKQSGGHFNPATAFTFCRLGNVASFGPVLAMELK